MFFCLQLAKVAHLDDGLLPKLGTLHQDIRLIVIVLVALVAAIIGVVSLHGGLYVRIHHPHFLPTDLFLLRLVSLIVATIPFEMPAIVNICLSIASRRLQFKYNVLVKKLEMIITLGTITMLIADKTGTLTQNVLSVVDVIAIARRDEDGKPTCDVERSAITAPILEATYRIAALCNEAELNDEFPHGLEADQEMHDIEAAPQETGMLVVHGSNATDRCILAWAHTNSDTVALRERFYVYHVIPFEPATRYSATLITDKQSHESFLLAKGSPKMLLPLCSHHMNEEGDREEWSVLTRSEVARSIDLKAETGCRMIVCALIGPLSLEDTHGYIHALHSPLPQTGMTFISCLALSDPLRDGVGETVAQLRAAGIKVMMVTGDAISTAAVSSAHDVGIVADRTKRVDRIGDCHAHMGATVGTGSAIVVLGRIRKNVHG